VTLMSSTVSPLRPVAFLGTGLMGNPMASRLLQAGYPVHVWNRTRDRAEALVPHGGLLADEPPSAVGSLGREGDPVDIVISMLADGATVHNVIERAIPALRPGMLWIDMSSTLQSEAKTFHAILAAHGVAFIDAPVSGGVLGAQAGTLAIMGGGSQEDFFRAEPVLGVLGRPTLVGPAGSGQLAKLCNQLIVGGTINIVAEALLLAQAGGANPEAVRSAIRGGFAESRILDVHGQRMLNRDFIPGGKVATQTKDMDNILKTAAEAGVTLPLTTLVGEQYHRIVGSIPMADHSAALVALEQMNPGVRLGDGPDKLPE
jgi:3-hydroxyisobutyrate dehydrogenase-like beta-hydroxyacid dehydrogenase